MFSPENIWSQKFLSEPFLIGPSLRGVFRKKTPELLKVVTSSTACALPYVTKRSGVGAKQGTRVVTDVVATSLVLVL